MLFAFDEVNENFSFLMKFMSFFANFFKEIIFYIHGEKKFSIIYSRN